MAIWCNQFDFPDAFPFGDLTAILPGKVEEEGVNEALAESKVALSSSSLLKSLVVNWLRFRNMSGLEIVQDSLPDPFIPFEAFLLSGGWIANDNVAGAIRSWQGSILVRDIRYYLNHTAFWEGSLESV